MSFDVFISYATEDKQVADATCATLERDGIRCWIAPRDLRPGEEYGSGIVRAIDSCKVLVLIFSSSANASGQVRRKVERAVSRGVAILPIRIENIVPTESLSYFVDAVHWMDAITPPLEDHLQRLAEVLKTFPFDAAPNQRNEGYAATTRLSAQRDASHFKKKTRLGLIAIAGVLLIAVAGGAWWAFLPMFLPGTISATEANLLTILARAVAVENRAEPVREYPKLGLHRALAVAPYAKGTWRTGAWPTREAAEEKVIERCSQFYNEACALVAVDDTISVPRDGGSWPVQDASWPRYAGPYNPERIPALRQSELLRPEVVGYATAAGPKAAAFNAEGILEPVTEASDQRTAEECALAACTAKLSGTRSNGPCYLYAVGNQVVLPLRSKMPLTATTPRQADVAAVRPPVTKDFRENLPDLIGVIAPAYPETLRQQEVALFLASRYHRAMALQPPSGSWRSDGWSSAAAAEQGTLEACQIRHGLPCILLAVDDRLQERPTAGDWPVRSMARVNYAGTFDPQQIPVLGKEERDKPSVQSYRTISGPKAAAIYPWGRLFIATGTDSQRSAEEKALADCASDPVRKGQGGPCWLYATGDQVVLWQRSIFAMTPAR